MDPKNPELPHRVRRRPASNPPTCPSKTAASQQATWPLLLAAALGLAAVAQAGSLALDDSVIAPGGGRSQSAGGCLAVVATIAEDTVAISSGGVLAIESGFWAGAGRLPGDALFNNGFQECL